MKAKVLQMARQELAPYRVLCVSTALAVLMTVAALLYFSSISWWILLLACSIGLLMCYGLYLALTLEIRQDLGERGLEYLPAGAGYSVVASEDYEASSAAFYIPILGDLFPKLWGPQMRKLDAEHLVAEEGPQYPIVVRDGATPYIVRMRKSGVVLGVVFQD